VLDNEFCRDSVAIWVGGRGKIGRGPRDECFEANGVEEAALPRDVLPHEVAACFARVSTEPPIPFGQVKEKIFM
jgi:hypothetical protein